MEVPLTYDPMIPPMKTKRCDQISYLGTKKEKKTLLIEVLIPVILD